jgi:Leucine-rich repeat (LRR) protein/ankyrin repeat protein
VNTFRSLRQKSTSKALCLLACGLLSFGLVAASSPDTQLIDAARSGDLADVKDAFAAGAQVNTPLGPAALIQLSGNGPQGQFKEVIAELLNHGADINAHAPDGSTVFLKALAGLYGQDAIPLFLAYHPDFNVTDAQGNGPLANCIQREDLKSVSMLVDAGAPVDVPNQDGITPLMLVAQGNQYRSYRIGEYLELAKYLISKGADQTRADKNGKTPATYALENNNYDLLLLLDSKKQYAGKYDEVKKADQNHRLGSLIKLHEQAKFDYVNGPPQPKIDTLGQIMALLEAGADPNALYAPERTTMFGAALEDEPNAMFAPLDPPLIKLLLEHGADPNKPFPDGKTPLMAAATNAEVFGLLLDKGADPAAMVNEQTTVLESPVPGQPPQFVKKQLSWHLVNLLASQGYTESLKLLLARKINLEQTDEKGLTPFLSAIAHGNGTTAQVLLDHGANAKAVSPDGQTATDLAAAAIDIGSLRKLDTTGKYTALLQEYSPPADAAIIGKWYLNKYPVLQLDADGGGSLSLRGPDQALGWKAIGNDFELDLMAPISPRLPGTLIPQKCRLTYDADKKRLTVSAPAGPAMILCRVDDPNPPDAMASMQAPTSAPSSQEDQVRSAIANAESSPNPSITLTDPNLSALPKEIYDVTGLTNLQIVGTKIAVLPNELGQFRLLTQVRINTCPVTEIQDGFFNLSNLEHLEISSCRLTTLSPKFVNFKKLTELSFYDNRISVLPEGWDQLPVLKSVNLTGNRLKVLPDSFGKAPLLDTIAAGDNMLSDLPAAWAGMGLPFLNLSNNRFTQVPGILSKIQGMTYLNLSGNQIAEIPLSVSSMATLQQLEFARNRLTTIPDLRNTHITRLDLSGNQINAFPPSKDFFPPTLRELNLQGNKIAEVPDWIFETNISFINLGGNVLPDAQARTINDRLRQAAEARRKQH